MSFLNDYGISEDDLKNIHEVLKIAREQSRENALLRERISTLEEQVKSLQSKLEVKLTADKKIVEENKRNYEGKMTPESFVEQFAGEVEEYYPNGIGRES